MSTIGQQLGAFWLAWKWVVILLALLVASLYFNYRQHMAPASAPIRAELEAARNGLALSGVLLADTRAAGDALRADVASARQTLTTAGTNYRRAVRSAPLVNPACAPGVDRVRAVNQMLGAPDGQ